MKFEVQTLVQAPKEDVWTVITDIENSTSTISAIESIEVLERGGSDLIGFRWRETRTMFGKQAEETMWITEAAENDFYQTRAESHGSVYISRLAVADDDGGCRLSMSFTGEARSVVAKIMGVLMMPFFKKATIKALEQDLQDIKNHVEAAQS